MVSRAGAGALTSLAVAALLFGAPSAWALKKVGVPGTDLGGGVYAGTAECPEGQRVVSGGFKADDEAYAVVNKAQGTTKWRAKARNAERLRVFAHCSDNRRVTSESDTVTFPVDLGEERTAKARCEGDRQAVYGGWTFKPSGDLADNQPVFKSRRKDRDKWAVTAFADTDAGERDKLKALVYCVGGRVDLKTRSVNVGEPVEPGGRGQQETECKVREEFLGGTFVTRPKSDFQNLTGPNLFYNSLQRGGFRGWGVEAHNYGSVPGRIKATTICAA